MEKIFEDLLNRSESNVVMIKAGERAQAFIRRRTAKGQYVENGKAVSHTYSTKPMPIPYGKLLKKMSKKQIEDQKLKVFKSKSGTTMVLLIGGYKKLRQLNRKNTEGVKMHWSARMMRNFGILRTSKTQTELGFKDSELEKIAYYQNVAGVGKNKKKNVFMDITDQELNKLADFVEVTLFKSLSS